MPKINETPNETADTPAPAVNDKRLRIVKINGVETQVIRSWGKMHLVPADFLALDGLAAAKGQTIAQMLDGVLESTVRPELEQFKVDFVPPADGVIRRTSQRANRVSNDPAEVAARNEQKRLIAEARLAKRQAALAEAEARAKARAEAEVSRAAKREAELQRLREMVAKGADGGTPVPDAPTEG